MSGFRRAITPPAPSAPFPSPYYEVITALDGISWTDAEAAAEGMVWQGQHGHLATIASAEENQFVFDLVSTISMVGPWLGGYQADGARNRWVWGYIVEFDTPPVAVQETSWGEVKAAFHQRRRS